MSHTPTAEQQACIAHYEDLEPGQALAVLARAGAGKTSTQRMMAAVTPERTIRYTAFNKAIVTDGKGSFPGNVTCQTIHSMAYRAIVTPDETRGFRKRIDAKVRIASDKLARRLMIGPLNLTVADEQGFPKTKVIQPGFLASLSLQAVKRFCQSADAEPNASHVPYVEGVDPVDAKGNRSYRNNNLIAKHIEWVLPEIWADACNPHGTLPYDMSYYVKLWERSNPRIDADVLFVDEAQDLNPVMISIFEQNADHLAIVWVGDSEQSINEWMGSKDALKNVPQSQTATLSQSFRFGTAVAEIANLCLAQLEATPMTGTPSIPSKVESCPDPDAILCRTNAAAVEALIKAQTSGKRAFMVGGGDLVLRFVEAAEELQRTGSTRHPDLAIFDSWEMVLHYVKNDPAGEEIGLLVRLVDDYGAAEIAKALRAMPRKEEEADLVISTAHKSKGREWDRVKLADDFTRTEMYEMKAADWKLLYVAATRARKVLDPFGAEPIARLMRNAGIGGAHGEAALEPATA